MTGVTIYTSMLCGYCSAAKRLLNGKGIEFNEIDVTMRPKVRAEMTTRANGCTSVPQIFIDDRHIGGYNDLVALDRDGNLDPLLRTNN